MSGTTVQQNLTSDLLDQACEWIVRLRADNVNDTDLEQFSDWVVSSDRHRHAFNKVVDMWGDLGVASALPVDELPQPRQPNPAPSRKPVLSGWLNWRAFSGAAAVVAVAAVTYFAIPPELPLDSYYTAVGEQRQLTLGDGSQVDLNTDTVLQVRFDDEQRWLHLVKGEAYFSVAKDKERPFIVDLDGVSARALGTEFNIFRKGEKSVQVTVTEGAVQIADASKPSLPKILQANHTVVYRASKGLDEVKTADSTANITAWRQQQMIFEDTPLHKVLSTLNRYSETTIELISIDAALLSVSGTFSTELPVETAQAVAETLELEACLENNTLQLYKVDNRI